jgi:hypothetical protein
MVLRSCMLGSPSPDGDPLNASFTITPMGSTPALPPPPPPSAGSRSAVADRLTSKPNQRGGGGSGGSSAEVNDDDDDVLAEVRFHALSSSNLQQVRLVSTNVDGYLVHSSRTQRVTHTCSSSIRITNCLSLQCLAPTLLPPPWAFRCGSQLSPTRHQPGRRGGLSTDRHLPARRRQRRRRRAQQQQ